MQLLIVYAVLVVIGQAAAIGIGYVANMPQRAPKVSLGLGKDNFYVQLDAHF